MNKEKRSEVNRLYRLNNKDKIKEINRLYRLNNKDKIKEINRLYRLNNKQKRKQTLLLTRLNNPHTQRAITAKRRALKLKATPKFANLKKIREIYKNCPKGYHVDHIVPLQGKEVCGLHVEWNLQYLTPSQNSSKSNKLINDYL
jgi:5-methylcytosine-specific restriction endonuclease McrA